MRFLLIFLLFLFTLFSLFFYSLLKVKNFYIDLDVDFKNKSVKEFILNVERVFNVNLYVNFKGIKLGKTIEVNKGKIIVVSLKKKKKRREALLRNLPIREIPLNLKLNYLDIWVGNSKRMNRVVVRNGSLINNKLSGKFSYTNLRNFSLDGNVEAKIKGNTLEILNLFLDNKYFSVRAKGNIGRNTGKIFADVEVKEIKKKNFLLSGTNIKTKGVLKLPILKIEAKVFVKDLIVKDKNYGSIDGIVKGKYELFNKLLLKGKAKNWEGTEVTFIYNVLPENLLSFSFKNLVIDEKTFGIKREIKGNLDGKGMVNFKNKLVKVNASTEDLKILNEILKGNLVFSYKFSGIGNLNFNFKNAGYAEGNLEIQKNALRGNFSFYDFPVIFKEFSAFLSGNVYINKRKSLEVRARIYADRGRFRDFSLQRIFSDISVRDKNIKAFVYYGKSFGFLEGEFNNLRGFFRLNDFNLKGNRKSIKVSQGKIEFFVQGKSLNSKGNLKNLLLNLPNFHAKTDLEFDLQKKGERISLDGKGILNAWFKEKNILKDFKYSILLLKEDLRIFGTSREALLRVVYDIPKKTGEFYGKINKENFSVSLKGRVIKGNVKTNFDIFYTFLREKIKLKGEIEVKKNSIKLSLFPTKLKGKRFNYSFKGFKALVEKGIISLNFKGLEVSLLDKKFLSFSPSKGSGNLKSFTLEPIKLEGVLNGVINIAYREWVILNSSGTLDLSLLSKHIGSLIKSQLSGKLNYEFELKRDKFKFLAKNKEPVRINSLYFYEPFSGAMNVEIKKDFFVFALTGWSSKGFLNAYALSKNFKDFEVEFVYRNLPIKLKNGVRARIKANGKGKVVVKNFKKILLSLNTTFDGYVKVKKIEKKKRKPLPIEITLDVKFKTKNGLVLKLPEGRVYTSLEGKVYGKLPDPYYRVNVVIKSGRLKYFGRAFFVKRSIVKLVKEKDRELTEFDFHLNTVSDGYKIFLLVHGTLENPKVYYFSEPPLSREQILFRLISGGVSEGILPVGSVLARELKTLGYVKGTLERLLDVNVEVGIKTSPTGEVGALVKLKKKLGSYLSLYYQAASTKDKKDTFWGVEVKSPGSLELGFSFNVYSDNTREYKLRYVKEFDF